MKLGLWLGLLLPALAPFVCPFPPFQDWPAHVGVVGALTHLDDPAARILTFYEYTGWFKLNMLFYLPAWGLAEIIGPIPAANAMLALSLGGLGPSAWLLCRAVDADSRLALLATPIALGRHVYCGFGPNAAALPLFVLTFALFFFARRRSGSPVTMVALVGVMTALAFTHAFIYLAAAGLLLLAILADVILARAGASASRRAEPDKRGWIVGLVALVVSGALFAVLAGQGVGVAGHAPGNAFDAIWQAMLDAPRDRLLATFWEWLFASYRYHRLDDLLQIGWAVGLIGAVAVTLALEGRGWWRTKRAALFGLAAVTVVMFWALPENVGPPVNWWGARLRLPALAVLLCLPLVGRQTGHALGPFVPLAGALSVAAVGLGLYDLSLFHRRYTQGLYEVLDAMPPGQKISSIAYTPHPVREYPGMPFGYFGNFYLAHKGGAVPQDFFERKELPFHRRTNLPAPPWGMAEGFRWSTHGQGFDGFLLKTDETKGHAPFYRNIDAVELRRSAGDWRYYRLRSSTASKASRRKPAAAFERPVAGRPRRRR